MTAQDELVEKYDVLTGRLISGTEEAELVVERKSGESKKRREEFLEEIQKPIDELRDPYMDVPFDARNLDAVSCTLYFVFVPFTEGNVLVAPFYPVSQGTMTDFCKVFEHMQQGRRVVEKNRFHDGDGPIVPQLVFECPADWIKMTNAVAESQPNWNKFYKALEKLQSGAEIGHCGISPETLGTDGEIRGTGLALLASATRIRWRKVREKIGNIIGDPRYAAPEVLDGQVPDYRSDLFSAAVTYCKRKGGQCRPLYDRNAWRWVADDFFDSAKFSRNEEVGLRTLLDPDPQKRVVPPPLPTEVQTDGQQWGVGRFARP